MVLALADAGAAHADVKMSGTFVADSACPASRQSGTAEIPATHLHRGREGLMASCRQQGRSHPLSHPGAGADPERRWVKIGCGHVTGGGAATRRLPADPSRRLPPGNPNMSLP
ncbi:hypothetical protein ACVOMV_20960 [Mesorhizobium atlanticum]